MSLWSFIGEMALFNLIFCKKRRRGEDSGATAGSGSWRELSEQESADTLQDRLDLLEDKLYECDEDSELYDDLQDRLDEMEYLDNSDLWNDIYDAPDSFSDDPDDW